MALGKCPTCGGKLCDTAISCPHCGYDAKGARRKRKEKEEIEVVTPPDCSCDSVCYCSDCSDNRNFGCDVTSHHANCNCDFL